MKIVLNFDNTIVRYDRVFHTFATEQGLVESIVDVPKIAVCDAMRATEQAGSGTGVPSTWHE